MLAARKQDLKALIPPRDQVVHLPVTARAALTGEADCRVKICQSAIAEPNTYVLLLQNTPRSISPDGDPGVKLPIDRRWWYARLFIS